MALLPLIRIAPIYCQHTEDYRLTFVVAIKSNESGLELRTLFPENRDSVNNSGKSQWPNHELEPQMRFLPGHTLSSKCGDQYYRCQELLVVNDESQLVQNNMDHTVSGRPLSIVFVPLETGMLLPSFWYDSNTMAIQWSTSIVSSSNCSPTVFYTVNSKFYMVCIGLYEEYVAVYEVRLNLSGSVIEFEGTALAAQLTINSSISNSNSSSNFSNFIIVDHRIYFAIGSIIFELDVLNSIATQTELSECSQVYKLVPTIGAGNQKLPVAYCMDRYICFDPAYGDWSNYYLFSSNGVPYLCPDSNYRATLFFNRTLQFSVRDSPSYTTNNVDNSSSGICFKSQNKTYFAYSGQQHNYIYVYDFTTQNHYPVSPYDCSHVHQDCPRLFMLGNQYLIIRDSNHDLVLDTKTNFSLIINISSGIADILAVLHSNIHSAITPSPPIILSTSSAKTSLSMNIAATSTLISTPNYTHALMPSSSVPVHSSTPATTASPGTK